MKTFVIFSLLFSLFHSMPSFAQPLNKDRDSLNLISLIDSVAVADNFNAAKQYYQIIFDICKKNKWWTEYLKAGYGYMGWIAGERSFKDAVIEADRLIGVASSEQLHANEWLGSIYHKKGVYAYQMEDFNEAEFAFMNAISVRKNLSEKSKQELSRSYHNLAVVLKAKGNYEDAANQLEKALELRRNFNIPELLADTYKEMGIIKFYHGDYGDAREHLDLALKINSQVLLEESVKDDDNLKIKLSKNNAQIYLVKGLIYRKQNEINEAKESIMKAIKIFREIKDERNLASSYHNMAFIYHLEKDYGNAIRFNLRAVPIFEKKGLLLNLANVYNDLGITFKAVENEKKFPDRKYKNAIDFQNKSLSLKKTFYNDISFHPEYSSGFDNIGDIYLSATQYSKALENYQLAIINQLDGFRDTNIYENPNLKFTLIIGRKNSLLIYLRNKANAFRFQFLSKGHQKDIIAALQTYQLCDQLIDDMRSGFESADSKLFLQEEAIAMYENAIATSYQLFQLTNDQQYLHTAFHMMEKSKSVLLLTSLKDSKAKAFANIPDSVLTRINNFKADIAYLEQRIANATLKQDESLRVEEQAKLPLLKRDYQDFIKQLEKDYPRYYQEKYKLEVVQLSDLQASLKQTESSLIEYFIGAENSYAFVISGDVVRLLQIPVNDKSLQPLASDFLNSIHSVDAIHNPEKIKLYQHSAYELYAKIWQPFASHIPAGQRVIVVPAGVLGYLPFEAFLEQSQDHLKFKQYPFLFKKHPMAYAYPATVLMENMTAPKEKNKAPFLGMAPVFAGHGELQPLQYSQAEVTGIQKRWGGKVLTRQDATRSAFLQQASRYDVLHLSSHAVVQADPFDAWIEFIDGPLNITGLDTLDLRAKMVVLSACETGTGALSRGEGIMSLSKRFAYAGCQSIVSSLWKVNHASTSQIMNHFYRHLENKESKDAALQAAKLDYLQDESIGQADAHPYYWAAFLQFGNRDAIALRRDLLGHALSPIFLVAVVILAALLLVGVNRKYFTAHRYAQ